MYASVYFGQGIWSTMIFLVGCDHRAAQTYAEESRLDDPENKTQREFRELLIKATRTYNPELVGEEYDPAILKLQQRRSVALEVAAEHHVCHRFCEPSPADRHDLGIDDDLPFSGPSVPGDWFDRIATPQESFRHDVAHRWPIREEFWIERLGADIHKRILFICGAGHRWTLRRRLESRSIKVKIIEKRFGASRISESFLAAYKDVRRNGFPPASGCFCCTPRIHFPVELTDPA
jgi:hypothetical protein